MDPEDLYSHEALELSSYNDIFAPALTAKLSLLELFFGLRIAVGDESVEETSRPPSVMPVLLSLFDLLVDVLLGLLVRIVVVVEVGY